MRTALVPFTTDSTGKKTYGSVVRTLMAGDDYTAPEGLVAVPSDTANVGDLYDGQTFAPPAGPALTVQQLLAFASGIQDATLASVFSFNVAASGAPAHTVTTKLDGAGQMAMLKVQGWLTLNASNPNAQMPYSNVDFSATALTVAEADSLVEQAAALDIQSYAILNQISAGITASPPTVTSFDQIAAAFAALKPAA